MKNKVFFSLIILAFVSINVSLISNRSVNVAFAQDPGEVVIEPDMYDINETLCFYVNDDPNLPIYEYDCEDDGEEEEECIEEDCNGNPK